MRKKSIVKDQQLEGDTQHPGVGRPLVSCAMLFAATFMSLIVACSPKAGQVRPNEQVSAVPASIDNVEVGVSDGRSLLTIKTTAPMQGKYTVMKVSDPPKVIIEMPDVEPGKFAGPIEVADGTVGRIETSTINGKGIRFEIGLSALVEHEVKADNNLLEVYFAKAINAAEVPAAKVEENPQEKAVEEAPSEKAQEEVKAVAEAAPAAPAVEEKAPVPAVAEQPVIEEKTAEKKIAAAEKLLKITDVKIKKLGKFTTAEIITDGEPSGYNVFDLKAPARVVVDIGNAREITAKRDVKAVSPHIKGARVGRYDGQVRVVFDYKGEVKPYDVVKGKDRIVIFFGRRPAVAKETVKAKEKVKKVATRRASKEKAKAEPKVEEKAEAMPPAAQPATQAAELKEAEVGQETPKKEEGKAVAKVEEKAEAAPSTQPVVQIAEVKEVVKETKPEAKMEEKAEAAAPAASMALETKVAEGVKPEGKKEGLPKGYTGQKVTLEFKDADIKNIFRVIAEVSGYNMIIDNAVSGKVTLRLINVPWDQALDLILETNNLGMTKVGNVIRVQPMAVIKRDEADKLASMQAKEKQEDLVTKLVQVSYAKASDIAGRIKSIMSPRGSSDVDERTNTIILKDIQKSVDAAEKLVASLDTPTPQVVIEARIVEANTNFTRDLGVQWGAGHTADAAHGNPTGYYFPNSYNVTAGGGGSFSLNPPATGGVGPTGGVVGISFGSINNTLNLDLRLSALETQGWGKVISSPKIITLDNKEASIQQGVSIPYETTSASGTQTAFVEASLNLTVTPHVTNDGRLSMKIKATKNAPSLAFKGASGAPSIDKKEANTEILVKDGDTTVIGGIYQITKAESESYTPFFGKLPIIGWLFKSKSVEDRKTELLIFITPRIVREKPV